jgi:hypothetical protein
MRELPGATPALFRLSVTFLKQAILCAPEGTEIQCEVTGNCCCFLDADELVNCVFDFCVVLQSKAAVKMLIPTFGFCVPAECKGVAACPPKLPKQCPHDDDC